MTNNPEKKSKKGVIGRLVKMLFKFFPILAPITVFGILFSSAVSSIPAVFQQKIIAIIKIHVDSGDWTAARAEIMPLITILIVLYALSIALMTADQLILAYITQGFLYKLRRTMFDHMQDLPIR